MKYYILLILLTGISLLPALLPNHIPPMSYTSDSPLELKINILQGWDEIDKAIVFFRQEGESFWEQIEMAKDTSQDHFLIANLPIAKNPSLAYEYYFQINLTSGGIELIPINAPSTTYFTVKPATKQGEKSPEFLLLSDESSMLAKDGYTLAVSWYALEDKIDVSSIRVYVNGKDVTKRVAISSAVLLYIDKNPRPGITTAYISAKTLDGKDIYSETFKTKILPSGNITALPMNLRGSFSAGTNVYETTKDANAIVYGSDTDDGWASLELFSEYRKLQLQAYSYVSTLQKEDEQNVNRFRFGMMLPFWETYVGDYSPQVSSLTLQNRNIRGIYSKLFTKYFALSVAHGEMVKAINGTTYVDSSGVTAYTPGTFKQEAFATRIQLGREDGLYVGLTTSRNRDIISSLDPIFIKNGDTQIAFPKDNLVLSLDARLNIPNQNVVIGIEGAGSLYNKNILPGPINADSLEQYLDQEPPINPTDFQDYFIINTNMQPLPLSTDFNDPTPLLAWTGYFRSFWYDNLLNLSYTEVNSAFKALGTSNINNDTAVLNFTDQYNFRNCFFATIGYTKTKDNLSLSQLETNIYRNINGQMLFRLPKLPYLLFAVSDGEGRNEKNVKIVADPSLYHPYKRNSNMYSLGFGYDFYMIPIAPTNVDIGWRNGNDNEKALSNNVMSTTYDIDSQNLSFSLTSRFQPIPLKTQFTINSNTQETKTNDKKKNNLNLLFKADYRLWKDKVTPWIELKTTSLNGDQDKQQYTYYNLGCEVRPWDLTTLSTSIGLKNYTNEDVSDSSYSTVTWRLTLNQRF